MSEFMKAYRLHDINDLRYESVEIPDCDEKSVIIKVRAAGICGSDIPRIYTKGTYNYPLIPGHEFSGEVVKTGKNVSKDILGKRVGIFPLIPCMKCRNCKNEKYEMCTDYSYLGSRTDGGFAEYVKAPEWNLIELPDSVTYRQAAMLEPMAVAVHAIRQATVRQTDTIAICGLGTIGLFIGMFLKEMGCENVYGIGNKSFQEETFTKLGFPKENYCDAKNTNAREWLYRQTKEQGADVFFECVGKNETILLGIEAAAASGTVLMAGNPSSEINMPQNVYWRILRKQLSIYGTWNSSFTHSPQDDWHYVLDRLKTGQIHPEKMITHSYNMDEFMNGFELMRDKREDYIKVMLLDI